MSASSLDKFKYVGKPGTATTLSAPGHTIGGTSITVASTTNWPTGSGVTFAIDSVTVAGDSSTQVAGTYTTWNGVVTSATTIGSMTLADDSPNSDQNYSAGSLTRVYITISAEHTNNIIDGILVEHNQDGTHDEALITSRTEDTDPDPDADFVLTYDTSATALKKAKLSNLTGAADGWIKNVLPAVSSVTNNGNRSYDITFASTVASILSSGMRLRTTRTVAAPTQCTSLNGTTQYYSKASPNKLTFTDDFVCSAWIKVSSYAQGGIVSRLDGTQGWAFEVLATGQIRLTGYNAGLGNFSYVLSYQSVPLNKWIHVTAQLDMSTFTASTTTSYVMFDGKDVPASVVRAGTNPTALVQAGNLNVGAANAATFFPGKIAQVAIYNAKVTQANILATISQGLSGSETSLASAYSFNNAITDLNTSTPNDLTANGSAVATNADSPFGNAGTSSTLDYALVQAVSTTVATVQVPEGCTIPTSGGVTSVAYSVQGNPYGWVSDKGRWSVKFLNRVQSATASNATFAARTDILFTVPTGDWLVGYNTGLYAQSTTISYFCLASTSQTGLAATASDPRLQTSCQASAATTATQVHVEDRFSHAAAATYTMYTLGATTAAGILGATTKSELFAYPIGL